MRKNTGSILIFIYCTLSLTPLVIFAVDFFTITGIPGILKYRTLLILKNTLIQSLLSVFFAFMISIPVSVYLSNKNNILTKLADLTIFIPFFFPPVSAGIAISLLLKNTGLNYTLFAVVLAHVFYNTPIMVKYISESLKTLDKEALSAARMDGANEIEIFTRITLPQISDGIFKGGFLVFTYCFVSFAVILSVGPIKYSTFETAIAGALSGSIDLSRAIGYVILQFIIIGIVNFLLPHDTGTCRSYSQTISNKQHTICKLLTLVFVFFEIGIVIYSIAFSFFDPVLKIFDPSPFIKILTPGFNKTFPVVKGIINSLIISGLSALITTSFAYILLTVRNNTTDKIILLSIGISGAMTGVTYYYMNVKFGIPFFILLIAGIISITLPIAYSFMYDNFKHFDSDIIDTAKIDGANRIDIFRFIKFPLLKTTVVGTFLQLFTIAFGEFTISFTMKIQNYIPVASVINYNIGLKRLFRESAAMSSINILIVLTIFTFSNIITRNKD